MPVIPTGVPVPKKKRAKLVKGERVLSPETNKKKGKSQKGTTVLNVKELILCRLSEGACRITNMRIEGYQTTTLRNSVSQLLAARLIRRVACGTYALTMENRSEQR